MSMLYKYPQHEFPYTQLLEENKRRSRLQAEFELIDSGVFDADCYFDVFIEYAKADKDDVLWQITAVNRASEDANLHLLPHVWFRNTWAWQSEIPRPNLTQEQDGSISVHHPKLPAHQLYCENQPELLFCENDTNPQRLYSLVGQGYFKDAFHDYVVGGDKKAVNPEKIGSKAAAYYCQLIPAGGSMRLRLRLAPGKLNDPFSDFEDIFYLRRQEADQFYEIIQAGVDTDDARLVQRQAYAGLLWSKQFYYYDIPQWLEGDPGQPQPPPQRRLGRNSEWGHLNNADIISMPDKWEYPWYAAWDLAFHCLALAQLDPEFAKNQLILLGRIWYLHPNGQLPAYEWNFSDVNPPVHAWATWRVYEIDRKSNGGHGDLVFLERVFHKLMLNFTWWVNRKDAQGHNIFQGGFLGLDNIGLFDRSSPLPTGGMINQSDGTAWMAMYSLNLMRIALELALHNPAYQDIASKFFEHFLHIAEAMTNMGDCCLGLWDEDDQFFYDVLQPEFGYPMHLKVRSMVGLIPLFAVEVLNSDTLQKLPGFSKRLDWLMKYRPKLAALVSHWDKPGTVERRLLSLLRAHRMKAVLRRMLDETEFLSDYGIRALSRQHRDHPYRFTLDDQELTVGYLPGESDSGLFGGNSNWRGPIWMPVNFLLIESLRRFNDYYGDEFKVECPTASGVKMTLNQVADELSQRLARIFIRQDGRRAVFGDQQKFQSDPNFRDYPLFYEYFHGDSGCGIGASHRTGWTALIGLLLATCSQS